jgi:hypothetical protein
VKSTTKNEKTEYPRSIFDCVVGLNRWVLRVDVNSATRRDASANRCSDRARAQPQKAASRVRETTDLGARPRRNPRRERRSAPAVRLAGGRARVFRSELEGEPTASVIGPEVLAETLSCSPLAVGWTRG